METIVVMSCCKFSISFEKKIIPIHEGETVSLRRALQGEYASKNNGLFDYPRHIEERKLSRNHAEMTCINSKVYLRAINRNTFINSSRVPPGHNGSAIKTGDTIFLGGGISKNMYETVIILVTIFSSTDEDYKYFCQLEEEYPFFCYFPGSPSLLTIKTEHLFSITMDRLKVLRHLSRFGEDELNSPETIQMVTESLKTRCYVDLLREESFYSDFKKRYEFMKDDHISQFILMIAFCRNKHMRYWFINQERKLFIVRWFKMFPQEQNDFLAKYKMDYKEVPHSESARFSSLYCNFFSESMKYFKVHFTEAPSLLKGRKVLIQDGFCYVRVEDMYSPVIEHLQTLFLETLNTYHTYVSRIWWDDRMRSIMLYTQRTFSNTNKYESKRGLVTEKNIHQLCDESFPLCMKILQLHLSRDHHLRNEGRYQYTLFLKGIGLSLANAVVFWKAHFTKKMDETVFMKRYSYHIRHAYGTEGKMADYRPKSCAEILKATPGPLEYHGCPFKVLDKIRMKEALYRSGINKKDYSPILEHVHNGAPQEACKTYFDLMHGEKYPHSSVEHPNLYYDESRKVRLRQRDKIKIKFDSSSKDIPSKLDSDVKVCDTKCQSSVSW
uniref:DNA primase large subunit n=3 Tax=Lygus hesperus TaxID=30085 RepID=A0A0A9X4D7_LYGHE